MAGDNGKHTQKVKKKSSNSRWNLTSGGLRGCQTSMRVVAGAKEHGGGGVHMEASEQKREEAVRERGNPLRERVLVV